MYDQEFDIGDTVTFQAYRDNEPFKGIVTKIQVGMCGNGKTLFGDDDIRLFYSLVTVRGRKYQKTAFTTTTPVSIVESKYFDLDHEED